jgi:hypothetical protein
VEAEIGGMLLANFSELRKGEVQLSRIPILGTWVNKSLRESGGFSPQPQIASAERRTWQVPKGLIGATVSSSLFSAATGVVLAAKRSLKRVPWSGWGMLVLAAGSYSR